MGVRISPEFCFTHWSTQAGAGGNSRDWGACKAGRRARKAGAEGVQGRGGPAATQAGHSPRTAAAQLAGRWQPCRPTPPATAHRVPAAPACTVCAAEASPHPWPAVLPALQCRSAFGGPVDPHLVLGGFPTDAASFRNFSADASAFVVTFPIDSHPTNRCAKAVCAGNRQARRTTGQVAGAPCCRELPGPVTPTRAVPLPTAARLQGRCAGVGGSLCAAGSRQAEAHGAGGGPAPVLLHRAVGAGRAGEGERFGWAAPPGPLRSARHAPPAWHAPSPPVSQ